MHHHLIREGTRTRCGLIVESGEPREVMHFCLLMGYGAGAINPYLAFATFAGMIDDGKLQDISEEEAVEHFIKALGKSLIKVASKMGISTLQSYRGAQIFEAIGLNREVIDKYFTWTASRVGGIGLDAIARESAIVIGWRFMPIRILMANSTRAASINGGGAANITCTIRTRSRSCSIRCVRATIACSRNIRGWSMSTAATRRRSAAC